MEIWIDPRLTEYLKLRKKALQQREAPALFQLGQIYLRLQTSGGQEAGVFLLPCRRSPRLCPGPVYDGRMP